MPRYVALLRGINVGGNNVIRMADLRVCFERMGFEDVGTYIQSGNVLFASSERSASKLQSAIERVLSETFDYESRVSIVGHTQLRRIVEDAPPTFGAAPDAYRYDVVFLMKPLTPKKALEGLTPKEGVDEAHPGKGVVYFSRSIAKASQSRLVRVASLPVYRFMTIRNWRTTNRLLAMLEAMASKPE